LLKILPYSILIKSELSLVIEILELRRKCISKFPQPPFAKGGRGGIYDFHISWVAKSAMGNSL